MSRRRIQRRKSIHNARRVSTLNSYEQPLRQARLEVVTKASNNLSNLPNKGKDIRPSRAQRFERHWNKVVYSKGHILLSHFDGYCFSTNDPSTAAMDFTKKLLRNYQAIVDDLDVQHIHAELFQKNALTSIDFDHLFDITSRDERTKYLLDTLITRGNSSAFETFVDSLAKDYSWLRDKLVENNDTMMNDSFEDSLSKGDVPRLPDHHVRRVPIERRILQHLSKLKRHNILALHGMSGSGKTCAAISALRENPDLIINNFLGVVLWLNLGNCKTDDDVIAQQTKLLKKTTNMYTRQSYMNSSISMSSIGSNGDSQSLSTIDWTSTDLRDRLKTQFLEQSLKESLLVLDEVNDRKCVEAFDIGCKIMITTRDTGVVSNYHPQIVKIENNFEKEESLQLFAQCLDEPVSKLPRQAKTLHEVCKGSPFHIALIGAQLAENKERFKDDSRHWDTYVKKLEKKDFIFLTRHRSSINPMKTIEICINSLNDNLVHLFKKLAILPDNVKILAKVLCKLWNKELTEVNSILKQLKSKSLIIETYDREQKNYLYEVHDIIMNYLRTCLNEDDKKKLHDKFLNSYNYTKNNIPIEIVDDGYIAFYIGYHILHSNDINYRFRLFKGLFLDLKWLGNKVRLTGPADVIADLQKYENYIASDDLDRSLILSIKAYLSTHGTDLYHYQCTDIIQSILQYENKGILFTKALEIAQCSCAKSELYFEFLHEQDVDGIKHSTIDVQDTITSICFLGDYVLVGTSEGVVKFFHIPTNKLKKELSEGDLRPPVKWIGVAYSKNPPIVTALFFDGVIRLWYVDDIDEDEVNNVIEEEPEESYNNNIPGNLTLLPKHGPVLNCRWTKNEDILIAQTIKKIILYRPNGEVVTEIDNFERDCELLCCVPCSNDRYIAVATAGGGKGIEIVDLKTKERFASFDEPTPESEMILDMLNVPGTNKIITLKEKEITQHEFKINPSSINKFSTWKIRTIITSQDVKKNMCFLSIAVNKTGTLLFVSTDDSRVLCIDLKTNSYVFDLDNRRGNVIAMSVSEILMWDEFVPGSDVLLTGTGTMENSAKVWYLDSSYISQTAQRNGKVRLTTKFDVSFLHTATPQTPLTSTPNSGTESANNTPRRHQSFANHKEVAKKLLKTSNSLDRHSLKPLNLKGICGSSESSLHPLLVVVDDKNNIQVMRGKKTLTEICEKPEDQITNVKITPCNQHIVYGLKSGNVKKYTLRTKDTITIMDMYSPVQYMKFVNANLLMVAGKNRCIMAYKLMDDGSWSPVMLQKGNSYLGSQEILNDIQGVKKTLSDQTNSESDASIESKDRMFPNGEKNLCKGSGLVECFWIPEGLITVENNASIKLWDKDLKLSTILNARQIDVNITCASLKKRVLVICDFVHLTFQTFELKQNGSKMELNSIQEYQLNNEITSCDLTSDGNILAMGLDSGNIVVWNVKAQRQISLLRHHKSKVQSCSFSPVPDKLYRNSTHLGSPFLSPTMTDDDQPPLVLVTMASEIVWWNITYDMRMRANSKLGRPGLKAMTPLATTPLENKMGELSISDGNANKPQTTCFFFGEALNQQCWNAIWKGKTCKQGSRRKEILACIKLSGMNAKRLCHDEKFSCFVTVDNPGHIHIMNAMTSSCT